MRVFRDFETIVRCSADDKDIVGSLDPAMMVSVWHRHHHHHHPHHHHHHNYPKPKTQAIGMIGQNVHTPVGVRKGVQAAGCTEQSKIIYEHKGNTWPRLNLFNKTFVESSQGDSNLCAPIIPSHAFCIQHTAGYQRNHQNVPGSVVHPFFCARPRPVAANGLHEA